MYIGIKVLIILSVTALFLYLLRKVRKLEEANREISKSVMSIVVHYRDVLEAFSDTSTEVIDEYEKLIFASEDIDEQKILMSKINAIKGRKRKIAKSFYGEDFKGNE